MAWRKIVEKAERDRELRLALLSEVGERYRHWFNAALAFAALHIGVLALGVVHPLVHAVFVPLVAAALWRARRWGGILRRVEESLSGDPVAGVREVLDEYGDEIVHVAAVALLTLLALLLGLGVIP